MRRLMISAAACVFVIWVVALLSPDVSAGQPQVGYNFSAALVIVE